jgi:serine/arginine repetitive matrix protein 2
VVRSGAGGQRTGPERQGGSAVDAPGAVEEFPTMDVKRSPARIDREREESGERAQPDRSPEPERQSDGPARAEEAIQEVFFESGTGLSSHSSEVDRLVEKLYRKVERRMQIERERRGL